MPSDLTRPPNGDLRQHYKAVVMQQGRVNLDRDFNALQDLVNGRIAADALDEIGPCGTPDDGLAISLPPAGKAVSLSVSASGVQLWDFLIKPGIMYVGGQRVVFDSPPSSLPPLSYFHQPDWANPPDPLAQGSTSHSVPHQEFIYLHAYEQEVGAVEDPDLLDVALGGPDTSQRVRLMRRIVRLGVAGTDCAAALADATADWGSRGYTFDPATMRLLPQVTLQVGFTAALSTANPCDPVAEGGYLGAENQLIRVMIGETGTISGRANLLWGYDNASSLYRVTVDTTGMNLQLLQPPVDAFHNPATGQFVEVLRTAAILGTEIDQTDPTGQRTIVRCVADATGYVTTVASFTSGQNLLGLSSALPAEFSNDSNPLFLRIWVGRQSFDPSSPSPIVLTDPTGQTSPGLQVTIARPSSSAQGSPLPHGAFWLFAVRPSTPQAIYPEWFLNCPQLPDGPRQWACSLAVIDWAQSDFASVSTQFDLAPTADIHDCRICFDNLVTLSNRRLGGCCTVTVWPSDAPRLQSIIDRASRNGRRVTVCLMPGTYSLSQPLRLTSQHSHLVLESCSGGATFQTAPAASLTAFTDGLVVLVRANGVTIRGLTFLPSAAPFPTVSSAVWNDVGWDTRLFRGVDPTQYNLTTQIGVRPVDAHDLTVENCHFDTPPAELASRQIAFSVGLMATGDCTGLIVRACRFSSGMAPTSTPMRIDTDTTTIKAESDAIGIIKVGPRFSTLFGILILPSLAPNRNSRDEDICLLLPTVLERAAIQGNDFLGLTLASISWARYGNVQINGNSVRQSLGGFWLFVFDAIDLTDQPLSDAIMEPNFGTMMGLVYPLPAEYDTSRLQSLAAVVAQPAVAERTVAGPLVSASSPSVSVPTGVNPASLLRPRQPMTRRLTASLIETLANPKPSIVSVLDNRIEALPAAANADGTYALWILINASFDAVENTAINRRTTLLETSVLVTANTFYGVTDKDSVVLLEMGSRTNNPAIVTGNLVVNTRCGGSASLWIFSGDTTGLAITGNVLVGQTSVSFLAQWAPLNSIQT